MSKRVFENISVKKCVAFTLAEMMVVMLILTIILAAFAPLMTKRRTVDTSSPWRYASNNSDIYYGMGSTQSAMIGQNSKASGETARLILNTSSTGQRHILFKAVGTQVGELRLQTSNFLFGSGFSSAMVDTGNTAFGFSSLSVNSSGTYNTAAGYRAMNRNTTASRNTCVGADACYNNTTGANNTALGVNPLLNNVTGSNNTAVGYNACNYVTGSNKTCIGTSSGPTATDSSTTNVVYLGSSSTTGIISGVSAISVYSDERLKNIKEEYKNGLEQIRNIVPKYFTYKKDENKVERVGVIAQEVQKVLPDAVEQNGDGYLIVKQERIQYALLNAVKQIDKLLTILIGEVKILAIKIDMLVEQNKVKDLKIKELEEKILKLEEKVF